MKETLGVPLRRSVTVAAMALFVLAVSGVTAGATSYTTTTLASIAPPLCGVVPSPGVHLVSSTSPCVVRVRVGTNVRIKMRSGFRWGYPISTSRDVVVTAISRTSLSVTDFTMHAAAPGNAWIRVTGTVACRPGVACPQLALLWSIKVIVT
jgi:hypothetical protein